MSKLTGAKLLLDSNILIYYFDHNTHVTSIVEDNFIHVSIISEIEVLGYKLPDEKYSLLHYFFQDITIHPINTLVKEKAIEYKKELNLRTADSIIAATSYTLNMPLISADQIFKRVDDISFILVEV